MALRGDLKEFPSRHLFELIHKGRKTGTLTISVGKEKARLIFERGGLIHTCIDGRPTPLVEILAAGGAITAEEKAMIDARARVHTDQEAGVLLESAGIVSREEILWWVYQHHKAQAERVLTWGEGAFVFETISEPHPDHIPTAVNVAHLLCSARTALDTAACDASHDKRGKA